MWVAVIGSRDLGACEHEPHFPPTPEDKEHQKSCPRMRAWKLMFASMARISGREGFEGFVSGGASGADTLAEEIAAILKRPIKVYRPLSGPQPFWQRAHARNQQIVDKSSVVLAFFSPGPRSPGTSDTIGRALSKGLEVHIWHEGRWYER